jgi:hypothetical protein
MADHFFDQKNLTENSKVFFKFLFKQDDLLNNFYFKQFFIQNVFAYTIIEIADFPQNCRSSSPTALGAIEP